jgi:hypothetical protein
MKPVGGTSCIVGQHLGAARHAHKSRQRDMLSAWPQTAVLVYSTQWLLAPGGRNLTSKTKSPLHNRTATAAAAGWPVAPFLNILFYI